MAKAPPTLSGAPPVPAGGEVGQRRIPDPDGGAGVDETAPLLAYEAMCGRYGFDCSPQGGCVALNKVVVKKKEKDSLLCKKTSPSAFFPTRQHSAPVTGEGAIQ
jgi:hypothetical protein